MMEPLANDIPDQPAAQIAGAMIGSAIAADAHTAAKIAAMPRIYGELLSELPKDLYIPPDALEVILESFEGPLDLLLYLIRRANVDVLDIPMAALTQQYLSYVDAMQRRNLELAAEYLLMAAMLIEIKSRMLLPRPPRVNEGEAEDPRAELVRRLLEYEQMKAAAAKLDALPQALRDYQRVTVWVADQVAERQPEVCLHDLQLAWLGLMKQARMMQHHQIGRAELSVREHMSLMLRRLAGGNFVAFDALFDAQAGMAMLVVSFLAMLELVRENLVDITQSEALAPIYVKLADANPLHA